MNNWVLINDTIYNTEVLIPTCREQWAVSELLGRSFPVPRPVTDAERRTRTSNRGILLKMCNCWHLFIPTRAGRLCFRNTWRRREEPKVVWYPSSINILSFIYQSHSIQGPGDINVCRSLWKAGLWTGSSDCDRKHVEISGLKSGWSYCRLMIMNDMSARRCRWKKCSESRPAKEKIFLRWSALAGFIRWLQHLKSLLKKIML